MDKHITLLNLAVGETTSTLPEATKENIAEVLAKVNNDAPLKNEVITNLWNKIGLTLQGVASVQEDVFARFYKNLEVGDTIEDILTLLIEGEVYEVPADGSSVDPFKVSNPKVTVNYHRINSQLMYTKTVHDSHIKRAFTSLGNFKEFVDTIIISALRSISLQNYEKGIQLLDAIDYAVELEIKEDITTEAGTKEFLKAVKQISSDVKYASNKYNKTGVLTALPEGNQVLFVKESVINDIDLEFLSGVFNLGKVDIGTNIIKVQGFEDDKQIAALLDAESIRIYKTYESAEEQRNAAGRYTNLFWHLDMLHSYPEHGVSIKFVEPATK